MTFGVHGGFDDPSQWWSFPISGDVTTSSNPTLVIVYLNYRHSTVHLVTRCSQRHNHMGAPDKALDRQHRRPRYGLRIRAQSKRSQGLDVKQFCTREIEMCAPAMDSMDNHSTLNQSFRKRSTGVCSGKCVVDLRGRRSEPTITREEAWSGRVQMGLDPGVRRAVPSCIAGNSCHCGLRRSGKKGGP